MADSLQPESGHLTTMNDSEVESLAEGLLSTVLRVGRLQVAHLAAGVEAIRKADNSPVTIADRESEEILLQSLARLAPGVQVVSEEAAAAGHAPPPADTFFLVDPLDGTKPFLRREPSFTINVALIQNGRPVFGILYAPAVPDFFVTLGAKRVGAARLPPSSSASSLSDCGLQELRTRPLDPNAIRALTSQTHLNSQTRRFLERYAVVDRRAVSSSLKFGLLARGEADVYPRIAPTNEWDTAAGHAVLSAAGGTVLTLDGAPLTYGKRNYLNPGFVAWSTPHPVASS
jgi:3'(2'), 5'-bisphosphate nucleotidase